MYYIPQELKLLKRVEHSWKITTNFFTFIYFDVKKEIKIFSENFDKNEWFFSSIYIKNKTFP